MTYLDLSIPLLIRHKEVSTFVRAEPVEARFHSMGPGRTGFKHILGGSIDTLVFDNQKGKFVLLVFLPAYVQAFEKRS